MNRFFKSAAFPILIVIVLAFFAQRLINTSKQEKPKTYSAFLQELKDGGVKSVQLKTRDNTVVVTERTGKTYETGYTSGSTDRLNAQLETAVQEQKLDNFNIQPSKTNAWLSLLTYVFPVYGSCALMLLGVLAVSGVPAVPQRPLTWLWLLLMALGPQIVGHSALNWALRYLSATYVALAVLGEPIGATLLAWWVLGESPTPTVIAGGVLILAGIWLASRAERLVRSEQTPCPSGRTALQ
jgi:hypothetical protein